MLLLLLLLLMAMMLMLRPRARACARARVTMFAPTRALYTPVLINARSIAPVAAVYRSLQYANGMPSEPMAMACPVHQWPWGVLPTKSNGVHFPTNGNGMPTCTNGNGVPFPSYPFNILVNPFDEGPYNTLVFSLSYPYVTLVIYL